MVGERIRLVWMKNIYIVVKRENLQFIVFNIERCMQYVERISLRGRRNKEKYCIEIFQWLKVKIFLYNYRILDDINNK